MRPVTEYIRTLLFEHDYVTVPNFGAFIANYLPSSFNEISGSLMPPQKRIAFNEILKQDDGLLATYISRRESLTIDEAKRKIQIFVTYIKDSLATEKSFHFERIGEFSLSEENSLVFDPDRRNNFFSESFGFDSIFPRQVEKKSYTFNNSYDIDDEDIIVSNNSYSSTGKNSKWTYILYSLPVLLLLSGLFLVLFSNPKSSDNPAKSSFNPLDYIPKREDVVKKQQLSSQPSEYEILKPEFENKNKIVVSSVEATNKKVNESKNEFINETNKSNKVVEPLITKSQSLSTINNSSERYLVVSGIFKNRENVEKLNIVLSNNGFSPRVIEVGKLMKVVAGEASSYEEAVSLANRHKILIGEKAAIIKAE